MNKVYDETEITNPDVMAIIILHTEDLLSSYQVGIILLIIASIMPLKYESKIDI